MQKLKKKYFRLNSYIHLISEGNNGCIYDLISGNIYSLDEVKNNILKNCESNIPLDQIRKLDINFLNSLYEKNIGNYYDIPIFIEKPRPGKAKNIEEVQPDNFKIDTIYIEIDNKCNLDCVFCKEGDNTLYRKTGCKRWLCSEKINNLEIWKKFIDQISKLNCSTLAFIGGEPFLKYEQIKELIIHTRKNNNISNICIYTNGTLIDNDIILFLKKNNVSLNIQVHGNSDDLYYKITKIKGQYKNIQKKLEMLDENNIPYKLLILVNRFNELEIEAMVKKYMDLGKKVKIDFIYPKPHNEYYSHKFLSLLYDKKNSLKDTKLNSFYYLQKFHNCYGSQLAVTADGNVIPCIMSRQLKLGNIKNDSIISILQNSNYETYKKLTKDKINACKSCSFRYGCFDCRAIEMSATNSLLGLEYCSLKSVQNNSGKKDEECC